MTRYKPAMRKTLRRLSSAINPPVVATPRPRSPCHASLADAVSAMAAAAQAGTGGMASGTIRPATCLGRRATTRRARAKADGATAATRAQARTSQPRGRCTHKKPGRTSAFSLATRRASSGLRRGIADRRGSGRGRIVLAARGPGLATHRRGEGVRPP